MNTKINENCPCPSTNCARHGKCEECIKHHQENGGLPYCERPTNNK